MRPTLIAASLSLILLAGTARSEDLIGVPDAAPGAKPAAGKPQEGDRPGGKRHEQMLKHFDKDGDGKLNDEEKAAAQAAMQERVAKMKENNPELFKKLDKDGDGKLSPEEMQAAQEQRKEGGGDGPRGEMLKRFDKDGDGKLNEEEMKAAQVEHQERMAKMKENNPELFKKLDKDGDGKVSPEEMRAAHEQRGKGEKGDKGKKKGE